MRDDVDNMMENSRRYKIVKELNPREFAQIFGMVMQGRQFDSVIDDIGGRTINMTKIDDNMITMSEIWGIANNDTNKEVKPIEIKREPQDGGADEPIPA